MRLDTCVAERYGITRSRALALIKQGLVRVNGEVRQKAGLEVEDGDAVEAEIPAPAPASVVAQEIPLRILYQDADLAVVYKPSGMVVHPAAGNPDGTLVNALLRYLDGLSGIGGEIRPGIVHRIDKDTSGLLLVAKNDKSHVCLSEQIGAHTVERAYLAIVQGAMKAEEGDIDRPVGRHPTDRKRMAIVGRTHQIRVHMASIGHPVLGDPVYGPKKPPYPVEGGQLLHAYKIGFVHPSTGEWMCFTAEPEERFLAWKRKLHLTN